MTDDSDRDDQSDGEAVAAAAAAGDAGGGGSDRRDRDQSPRPGFALVGGWQDTLWVDECGPGGMAPDAAPPERVADSTGESVPLPAVRRPRRGNAYWVDRRYRLYPIVNVPLPLYEGDGDPPAPSAPAGG